MVSSHQHTQYVVILYFFLSIIRHQPPREARQPCVSRSLVLFRPCFESKNPCGQLRNSGRRSTPFTEIDACNRVSMSALFINRLILADPAAIFSSFPTDRVEDGNPPVGRKVPGGRYWSPAFGVLFTPVLVVVQCETSLFFLLLTGLGIESFQRYSKSRCERVLTVVTSSHASLAGLQHALHKSPTPSPRNKLK